MLKEFIDTLGTEQQRLGLKFQAQDKSKSHTLSRTAKYKLGQLLMRHLPIEAQWMLYYGASHSQGENKCFHPINTKFKQQPSFQAYSISTWHSNSDPIRGTTPPILMLQEFLRYQANSDDEEGTGLLLGYKSTSSQKGGPSSCQNLEKPSKSPFFLDQWDRRLSEKVHLMQLPRICEFVLGLFGHLFNRGLCVISFAISGIMAGYYPEEITQRMAKTVPESSAIRVYTIIQLCVYVTFNILQLAVLLLITQSLKHLIRRQRPLYATPQRHLANPAPPRSPDLALLESGTLSMPSGDTCQAAHWVAFTHLFFHSQSVLAVIPLVAMARVYFRCHWVGDTVGGAVLGIGFGYFGYFIFILGKEQFMKYQE